MPPLDRLLPRDPRLLQIAFLSSFLLLGVAGLGLQIDLWMPPVLLASTCGLQWGLERLLGLPSTGFRSPIISALGLSLLLRTDVLLGRSPRGGDRHRLQVRLPRPGQARLQPHHAGAHRLPPRHRPRLVLAEPVG